MVHIIVFTRSFPWALWIQSLFSHPIFVISILILLSYLHVGISSSLFPSDFPKKKFVYVFYTPHEFYMAQPYHLLYFITVLGAARTVQIMLSFKMFRNQFISEKNKTINDLSYISFKILPLCNYELLSETVKILETFLEAILWKTFKLFRRIHKDVSSITKAPSLQCCFQSREKVKISCSQLRI